jgi:hypothetical protein
MNAALTGWPARPGSAVPIGRPDRSWVVPSVEVVAGRRSAGVSADIDRVVLAAGRQPGTGGAEREREHRADVSARGRPERSTGARAGEAHLTVRGSGRDCVPVRRDGDPHRSGATTRRPASRRCRPRASACGRRSGRCRRGHRRRRPPGRWVSAARGRSASAVGCGTADPATVCRSGSVAEIDPRSGHTLARVTHRITLLRHRGRRQHSLGAKLRRSGRVQDPAIAGDARDDRCGACAELPSRPSSEATGWRRTAAIRQRRP